MHISADVRIPVKSLKRTWGMSGALNCTTGPVAAPQVPCSVIAALLIVWGVGFWATREPRQGPRREWRGPGNCGSVPSGLLRRSAVGFISSGAR